MAGHRTCWVHHPERMAAVGVRWSRWGQVSQPDTAGVLQPASWWRGSPGLQHVRFRGVYLCVGNATRGSQWSSQCHLCKDGPIVHPEAQESL